MAVTDIQRFSSLLLAKEAELTGSLHLRNEIVIEQTADALDAVQFMRERELAVRSLALDSNVLRLIRRALTRIADGAYGICLDCEEEISPKRLAAVPWASYCIQCQQQIDRGAIVPGQTQLEFAAAD